MEQISTWETNTCSFEHYTAFCEAGNFITAFTSLPLVALMSQKN